MFRHSDRRETQQSAKRGPPLRGCRRKPLGRRRIAWTGYQPALAQRSLPKCFLRQSRRSRLVEKCSKLCCHRGVVQHGIVLLFGVPRQRLWHRFEVVI
jgi:hypothetical protein